MPFGYRLMAFLKERLINMFQCQRCGNAVPDGQSTCPVCGTNYQMPPMQYYQQYNVESEERVKFKYALSAKIDTYGVLWKMIGILQIILAAVILISFIVRVIGLFDAMGRYDASYDSIILTYIVTTLFIIGVGFSNFRSGNAIFKGAKLAITNPEDVMGKFFKLKPMFISLIYNAIICGAIGSGIETTQITIGLIGIIGVVFGFYVRFYILKHEYLLTQSASQNTPPSQYAQPSPSRR